MNNLISIIIPTFNRANLIKDTIESIRSQSYTNWECIIIDGGSTDNSDTIIPNFFQSDIRFNYLKCPINSIKGPNASRNYGFQLAKGTFIYFFDSDDRLLPNAFETYMNSFDDETDVVIAQLEKIDFTTNRRLCINRIYSQNLIEDYFTGKISFYVCGPMWKKSFLDKQGDLFDENISNLDDWDFNLRMVYQKPTIKFLDTILIQYRQHEFSLKQELNKLNLEEIDSAFRARFKHLNLITTLKLGKKQVYLNHILSFYKHYLRLTIRKNDEKQLVFLKQIILFELKRFHIFQVIKVLVGTFLVKYFKKGERLLS